MQSQFTYDTLGFTDKEKEKIEKRMSKEFIDEYIKYIQARNEFNATKHTKAELKQKVLDYAVHANVDPKDSEKLREKEDELKRESDKTDKDHELFYKDYSEEKGDFNAGREMQYVNHGKTTTIYGFLTKNTKKSDKRLIYGKMHNLYGKRHNLCDLADKTTYDNDIITSHAILSLLERQPKYYTNYVMSKVGGHLQDSDTWNKCDREKNIKKYDKAGLIKNNARLMVFPQPDTDEGNLENGNNNFHVIENGRVKRISWIDIGGFLHQNWPSEIPSIKKDEKELYLQEFNKFLCVTPKLIELSVRQHLMAIGVKDEKILKEQTMKALNYYSIALKTFASYKDIIDGRDSKFENDLNYVVWIWNGDTYYSRLKQAINTAEEKDKKQFLEIVNDQSLQARLEKAINDFDNYKNKLTTKTATNERKGNISEETGSRIQECHVDSGVKNLQDEIDLKDKINKVIAKRLGKKKTLYWDREGKDKKLMNKRFFLKENAGYIRKINNYYDKMCKEEKQNNREELQILLDLAKNEQYRPISACY